MATEQLKETPEDSVSHYTIECYHRLIEAKTTDARIFAEELKRQLPVAMTDVLRKQRVNVR